MLVNGQIPGPTIEADWGDMVQVTVTNSLQTNGTAIHFHGIRQNLTNSQDGVPGVTQCPLAPGDTQTYLWKADQYGTSWYHSHFSLQYGNGMFGPIIVNGPTSSDYDEDLGAMTIQDWYWDDVFSLYARGATGAPPSASSGLINGMNNFNGSGEYHAQTVTKGTRYKLHIINTGVFNFLKFSIDNHQLTVVSADFVAVQPYNVTTLGIALGQRYEVIFDADQDIGNYWIRAVPQTTCEGHNNPASIKAILRYDGADTSSDPSSSAYTYTDECSDITWSLEPVLEVPFGTVNGSAGTLITDDLPTAVAITTVGDISEVKWYLNGTSMEVDWNNPSLGVIEAGGTVSNLSAGLNTVTLSGDSSSWYVFYITTNIPADHPIHVHGHDWFALASGTGTFGGDISDLVGTAVPRRDVIMLPQAGYLVLALPLDNPGVWLMHCHIAYHVSEGLSLQFLERSSEIAGKVGVDEAWHQTCTNWDAYDLEEAPVRDDSGV
ncbi:hypothetical protein HK405_014742 [Cladochytrium tenue]|nr:hypothetical protein HK405_014742 [Cladochytrium tenue]